MAYIDPGTGSMALQILIAGLLGTLLSFWRQVRTFLRDLFGIRPDRRS